MEPTDFERARWQGQVEAEQTGQNARLDDHGRRLTDQDREIDNLKVEMATMKTKVAFWAGLGAIAGGAVVSLVVSVALGG